MKKVFRFNEKNLKLEELEAKCNLYRIVAKKMGVVYCVYDKGWVHNNIKHQNEEFLYVIKGLLTAKVGNSHFQLASGDGVLISQETLHSFVALKKTTALVFFAPPITSKQAKQIMKKAKNKQ